MARKKRVAVIYLAANGDARPVLTGIGRFAEQRTDWILRWVLDAAGEADPAAAAGRADGVITIAELGHPSAGSPALPQVVAAMHAPHSVPIAAACDLAKVGALAGQHLSQLGHREMSCVALDDELGQHQADGFSRFAQAQGIVSSCVKIAPDRVSDELRSRAVTDWLRSLQRPAALFVTCSRLAANLCEVVRELGIELPNEMAIVATGNDHEAAAVSRPPLSTVELPWNEIGFQAARQLERLLAGKPAKRVVVPPTRVTPRRSSDSCAVPDVQVREVLQYIAENSHRPIGVRDAVRSVGTSRRTLEQRFRNALQRTIMEEIRLGHLRLALQKLRESNENLEAISRQCGLRNATQLGILVRRYTGMTPREYRRNSHL